MATVTVKLMSVCSGGGHLTFAVTGAANLSRILDLSSLTDPIEERDVDSFLRVIAKLAKQGRTVAQTKTLLQTGVVVTV